jgi:mRNA-degrading endonuclease RelE of RelBE toxin-antitoxin system
MKFRRLSSFKEDLDNLPKAIRDQAKEKFKLFKANPNHPSLRIKKMKGYEEIWEGHVTQDYVFTFHWDKDSDTEEPIAVFRHIGTHKIYKNP